MTGFRQVQNFTKSKVRCTKLLLQKGRVQQKYNKFAMNDAEWRRNNDSAASFEAE